MRMCDFNHDEIVYDSSACPVCDIYGELKTVEVIKDTIEVTLENLEHEHEKLVNKVREYSPELLI